MATVIRIRPMKHALLALLAAVVALSLPASARTPDLAEVWNGAEIRWHDMASGVPEAERTGKTALLVFHATWCKICRKFRAVFKDPGVVAASRDLVMILIDIDKDPDLNASFAPDGTYVPRTVFVDPEGNVIDSLQSANPNYRYSAEPDGPDELLSLMRRAAALAKRPAPRLGDRAEN